MAVSDVTYDGNYKNDDVEAWYMDESMEDQRLPHHLEPKLFVSSNQLKELGVFTWQLNGDEDHNVDEDLKKLCEVKGYTKQFVVEVSPEKLPNYDVNIKKFYEEHLHEKEETHYIIEGSGYFDVRDKRDSWIRMAANKGCIISLPAGIYHRFSIDTSNYIKAIRLFSMDGPFLTLFNRPSDDHPVRKEYVEALMKNTIIAMQLKLFDGH